MTQPNTGANTGQGTVSPLVSPEWLAARLADPHVRILDIRSAVDGGARAAYEQGHAPGAVHTDYVKDGWRAVKGMASGLLPPAEFLAALFGRLGLTPDQHAVIVSAGTTVGDFSAAARVYWTLVMARHRSVSLLDGGMAAWRRDPARPVEAGAGVAPAPTHYPVAFDGAHRSDLAAVERAVAAHSAVLLDSRSRAYFEGREKSPQALRAGRLPGAVLLDHATAFDAGARRLKPLAELTRLYGALPQGSVINFCNTGQQAATNWFVLSQLLRRPGTTLYDGSMAEWTENAARAVEVG